jgi:hypothetical protein
VPPPPPSPPPLSASLSKGSYKVASGKRLALAFDAARAGQWAIAVRRGKKVAKRFKGAAKAGKNSLRLKLKLKPGRYRLVLTLRAGADTTTDTAKLRISR